MFQLDALVLRANEAKLWGPQFIPMSIYSYVKSCLCIQTAPKSSYFNCDGGYNIPNCWIAMHM